MTDPDMNPEGPGEKAMWALMGLMALVVVGGLAYGLSYPSLSSNSTPQTTGSSVDHVRPGNPR